MPPPHGRRPLLGPVPAVLVTLLAFVVLLAHPSPAAALPTGASGAGGPVRLDGPSPGAEVARLFDEAARITAAYERGRRGAAAQQVRAGDLQAELARTRRELAALNRRVGEVARAQYRTGGSVAVTARLLLADDPEDALRAERVERQADAVVDRLLTRTARAERRLAAAADRARAAWRELEERRDRLAELRRDLVARLERARWRLQAEADRSVAAGRCRGTGSTPAPDRPADPDGPAAVDPEAEAEPEAGGAERGGGSWVAPVSEEDGYTLSAPFAGTGRHWAHRHTGQDFAVDIGTPVRAVGAGRVHSVACGGAFGIEVVVRHAGGWYSQYAHLASAAVPRGRAVTPGERIGLAGTTGNSTGPHLHFEVRLTPHLGSGVDPVRWLRERGVVLAGGAR
ncbi:peptidoglycan DD-metalloendopeptidase family protein [Streptomyces sp. DH12]|uniref:M23 family metallopeptidase n=1 Tax=Streptomyces sp. DH12 TaxID=2857010 RepID=UPI001E41A6EC|nr:peptidoglycan DD-metalloendopeptidase family protein [Streptomyces sp. DH12]